MNLLLLAMAPGIAICIYIYVKDRYNREPLVWLLISFILGMLSVIPAFISEMIFMKPAATVFGPGMLSTAISAFLVVGLSEEGSKYLMVRYSCYNRKSFDDPFDGIVYSVVVSMGFATLENIGYVYQHGFGTGVVRMFLSVPAHATFGVIMGYYVGLAKFNPSKKFIYLMSGLLLATFFHGAFDFFLFLGNTVLHFLGALVSFFVAIKLSRRAIRKKQAWSKSYIENDNDSDNINRSLFSRN